MGKCPICKGKMVHLPYIPSALDNIICPKCGCREVGFFVPRSLGAVVVNCRCGVCGHVWSVRVVLPKNLFR